MAIQVVPTGDPSTLFTRAQASWFLPPDPTLTGGTFYTQWVCNDSAIGSPVKVTLSSACAITLGAAALPGPRLGTTLWKYGAAGTVTESGLTAGADYVAVTRFTGSLR
jgi:hypothetical protein